MGEYMNEITFLRREIESIDKKILTLLARRLTHVEKIAELKQKKQLLILDTEREKILKEIWRMKARELQLECDAVSNIFNEILLMSKSVQRKVITRDSYFNMVETGGRQKIKAVI